MRHRLVIIPRASIYVELYKLSFVLCSHRSGLIKCTNIFSMSVNNTQSPFVQCMDCSFITTSQGHLGIHKAKMHRVDVPENIKSVNIVRLFPDGKSYHCCLCNSIIASFANFKCHFQDLHKGISLNIAAKSLLHLLCHMLTLKTRQITPPLPLQDVVAD